MKFILNKVVSIVTYFVLRWLRIYFLMWSTNSTPLRAIWVWRRSCDSPPPPPRSTWWNTKLCWKQATW